MIILACQNEWSCFNGHKRRDETYGQEVTYLDVKAALQDILIKNDCHCAVCQTLLENIVAIKAQAKGDTQDGEDEDDWEDWEDDTEDDAENYQVTEGGQFESEWLHKWLIFLDIKTSRVLAYS